MNPLPIDKVLPELKAAFHQSRNVVLSAAPGAGKTTRVPVALLNEPWLAGEKIVMLEPRRLAAQRAATYMAQQFGERVGETIGYRIRGENKTGKRTRIEVITEGILTRFLQNDPTLPGIGIVIFDEYHERSIHADLGLAFTIDAQNHLRNDLRILVMSATLDGVAVASLLPNAQIIKSEGRSYPVATHYLENPNDGPIENLVVSAILRALREESGDILVFLPGQREIRRVEQMLVYGNPRSKFGREESTEKILPKDVAIHALFGDAPPEDQRAAFKPATSGIRKVILSTSVAETSLTIDGIGVVIDSGLARGPRFDPRRGMSGLVTTPVSKASADQRRGRAGRQQAGACYRLWTERHHIQLPDFTRPEILEADLTPLALEFAMWGTPEGDGLCFLDPPPAAHLAQARELLVRLGALNQDGKLTSHGRAMAELPVHPRFAHMLLRGKEFGLGALSCEVAALLDERDLLRGKDDVLLHSRLYLFRIGSRIDFSVRERIRANVVRLQRLIGVNDKKNDADRIGLLLALAYPDRVAKSRDGAAERFLLSGGTGATLPKGSMLSRHRYLAVGEVDGVGGDARIFLAEPITEADIREAFAGQIIVEEEVHWDGREEAVVARQVERFGAIELSESASSTSTEAVKLAMMDGIRALGLEALPWTKPALSMRLRSEWLRLRGFVGKDWPDLGDENLTETLDVWLGPYLDGITRRSQLARLEMSAIIQTMFAYHQRSDLDFLAPIHFTVPTGSRILLEYNPNSAPVLAVRIQEMFGETKTPTVAGGKEKVVIHLLSPARRPLAVTQDLPSFWTNAYPEVRKEMRGRYPKHYWPENPREAQPTKRSKRLRGK